jgi:8-oxo-dGTP pyrophosphatase MutT (NUDIX family)
MKLPPFDPRQVPVVGVDHHLSAVAHGQLLAPSLRQRFLQPPQWQPEVLAERRFTDRPVSQASVLIPIVQRGTDGSEPAVLLTQRTAHMSTHSGQIAFPGGKDDPNDANAWATALREAHEEVGLAPQYVEVLGTLPTYFTGTAFVVTPVVALVQPHYQLALNHEEVADAFEVPLAFLMNPANHRRHVFEWGGVQREWFSMPYEHPQTGVEHFIWGATAGMLRNLYRLLIA